jgi:hypothetical protein
MSTGLKRFIRFHGVRHPQEMGAEEVKAFLSHLATQMKVAASMENQAFSAQPSRTRSEKPIGLTSERQAKRLPTIIAPAIACVAQ